MVKITPPQISIIQKKKMIHVKCHINPQWGNFYNMLFFNSKNCLNGKNHSSSGSHHHLKIPLPPTFPSPQWADIPNPLMLFWKYRKIWDKSRIQWCCLLSLNWRNTVLKMVACIYVTLQMWQKINGLQEQNQVERH